MFKFLPSAAICAQLESDLPETRQVSALLSMLQVAADMLAQVGGENEESLSKTMKRLKIVPAGEALPKSLGNFRLGHLELLLNKLRFVRAKRMVLNNHWPFENAPKEFFEPVSLELLGSAEQMLHHVVPGSSSLLFFLFISSLSCLPVPFGTSAGITVLAASISFSQEKHEAFGTCIQIFAIWFNQGSFVLHFELTWRANEFLVTLGF